MGSNGASTLSREDYAGLLIDRLATAIVDSSLPLKDVERELRGSVADVAIHKRGLGKRETASRCGVTEKSIENYLKEVRTNPKSPEREIARALQDQMLSLEEVFEVVSPVISTARNFTLDDAKRVLDKLICTGEVREYPGHKYRAVDRPAIRYPATIEAHRELVDQKARDLDYIIVSQKNANEEEVAGRTQQRYSRVVSDTNLVRIDFTVRADQDSLGEFYEELSGEVAKLTMKYEQKKGRSRVRLILGMRSVMAILALALCLFFPAWAAPLGDEDGVLRSWELDDLAQRTGDEQDSLSWLLRGDVNASWNIGLTDAILLTAYLAGTVVDLPCQAAADINQDGLLSLADAVLLFEVLYVDTLRELGPVRTDGNGLHCEAIDDASQ